MPSRRNKSRRRGGGVFDFLFGKKEEEADKQNIATSAVEQTVDAAPAPAATASAVDTVPAVVADAVPAAAAAGPMIAGQNMFDLDMKMNKGGKKKSQKKNQKKSQKKSQKKNQKKSQKKSQKK